MASISAQQHYATHEGIPQRQQQQTRLVKPRAVKAVDMMPLQHQQQNQIFTAECRSNGIPEAAVEAAIAESREWHRKWITDQGPTEKGLDKNVVADTMDHYTKHMMQQQQQEPSYLDGWAEEEQELLYQKSVTSMRQMGAKNPSLSDGSDRTTSVPPQASPPLTNDDRCVNAAAVQQPSQTSSFRQIVDEVRREVTRGNPDGMPAPPFNQHPTYDVGPAVDYSYPAQYYQPQQQQQQHQVQYEQEPNPSHVEWTPMVHPSHLQPVATAAASVLSQPQMPTQQEILRPIPVRPLQSSSYIQHYPSHMSQQQLSQQQSTSSPLTLPSQLTGSIPSQIRVVDCGSSVESSIPSLVLPNPRPTLEAAKESLLHALAIHGGDVDTEHFEETLLPLEQHYTATGWDARDPDGIYSAYYAHTRHVEGMWLTLSKPTYFGNLGESPSGDPLYTLGRMAFDMFLPTQLICSLQGNFNPIRVVTDPQERIDLLIDRKCPKSMQEELDIGNSVLRTYDIVTAFTIEPNLADFPDSPNKNVRRPIKGIMTTHGYCLPDPATPNRLSIWFTGGKITPNDDPHDEREWKRLFGKYTTLPQRTFGEKVRVLAANLLMGAKVPQEMLQDGTMEFHFTRPLGGHGVAYNDVVYMDDSMRIVKGHRGTIFVFARIPE